jgi:hypothetical protein
MKIFCHLMDMCALDAYHMPRKLGGKRKWLMFLIGIAEKLIEKYGKPRSAASVRRPSKSPRPT